ncbi:MAG: PfkB family carbohydrate kinase, partial [Clostridia bacterium]
LLKMLDEVFNEMDAVIILDQMVENNCGVITDTLRKRLITLGAIHKDKIIFADSRSKIHLFENMAIKCNNYEICSGQCAGRAGVPSMDRVLECAGMTYRKNKKPVFVTMGKDGILTVGKQGSFLVPTADVPRPYDICGAGDSVTAAAVSALASGWNEVEAAFFANIVASVTIRKIGVTGTASYEEVLETHEKYFKELKWQELH